MAGFADAPLASRVNAFLGQPAIRKSLPAFAGLGALSLAGALYLGLSSGPQRVLYSSLSDGERAQIVETLESGGVTYDIDAATGTLTVSEDDLYRARMLVASNGALAAPETGSDMLNSIPLGASRTLEGERLRLARERELTMTIAEIDGIEAARVHLATPERSVFVREKVAPSASVMVRLTRGSQLEKDQVDAIVNLVAGSVPGLSAGAVQVVDQNGQLLSVDQDQAGTSLTLQREFESKLRDQLAKLLIPMLGAGNFSTEVQVSLDMQESTSARESYDKDGALRNEAETRSVRGAAAQAGGVPGVLANTPPPPAELADEAPEGTAPDAAPDTNDTESSARRTYALGREVAVTSTLPGSIARLSVAVAVSEEALKKIAPADEAKLRELIQAAVGANPDRGDTVTVMVGAFEPATIADTPFYETSWFAMALRYSGGLIALLLVLLLGVRPLLAILRGDTTAAEDTEDEEGEQSVSATEGAEAGIAIAASPDASGSLAGPANLREQVALARRIANEQPDRAVTALQRMLAAPRKEA
ncbi:flagellar M-ring protein FliF [Erythrobacter jejuensis]|uniref:Flagellar M-ring protein n=2 Tax=Parerythrobacter jejuensis TaxID=795812 RepID=A0A845AP22_9SPHN|nr:flagellar M-ring protein FliF [Parerythrobacter jejuensis]MXP33371.1 flagellar M-ring protein FliF [Parerythrobacter jejuensis]